MKTSILNRSRLIATEIAPQLLKSKGILVFELSEIPHLKILLKGINDRLSKGTTLHWQLSNGASRKNPYLLELWVSVDDFYIDGQTNDIYFDYYQWQADLRYWKVATPTTPTAMWVTTDALLIPCPLWMLRPLIPHIHQNIKQRCCLFSRNNVYA